jgi:two-component sensor histidine kinase
MKADIHPMEAPRLEALRRYDILDTPVEPAYDAVVNLVADICDMPIAVINLIDSGRQWFKAEKGLGVRELPLDASICAHAILQPGLFVVPDTQKDARFRDNPLVRGDPHLRFYAGALLETKDGLPLGTVCVLDYKPRELNDRQRKLLLLMAQQVMAQLELRVSLREKEEALRISSAALAEKVILIQEIDHRVQNSLAIVAGILRIQSQQTKSEESRGVLSNAERHVQAIASVHRQLQQADSGSTVDMAIFLHQLCSNLQPSESGIQIRCLAKPSAIAAARATTLGLIVNELVTNAIKYAYPSRQGAVTVEWGWSPASWTLQVSDNGVGLPKDAASLPEGGLGTKILHALVPSLNATLENRPGSPGTIFVLKGTTLN